MAPRRNDGNIKLSNETSKRRLWMDGRGNFDTMSPESLIPPRHVIGTPTQETRSKIHRYQPTTRAYDKSMHS